MWRFFPRYLWYCFQANAHFPLLKLIHQEKKKMYVAIRVVVCQWLQWLLTVNSPFFQSAPTVRCRVLCFSKFVHMWVYFFSCPVKMTFVLIVVCWNVEIFSKLSNVLWLFTSSSVVHMKRKKKPNQNTHSKKATKELSPSLSKLSFLSLVSLLSISLQENFLC